LNSKKLVFSVENISPVEDSDIDKTQFSKLLIDCFSTSPSAHDTFVSEETLKRTAKTILLKPVVFAVDERLDDAAGHELDEVPAGFIPSNSILDFRKSSDGSHIIMSIEALIWKRYSGRLLDYFRRDGSKGVSVEIEVFDAKEDEKTGLMELVDYCYNAITILGEYISPAISGAKAVLQFSEDFKQAKEEYENLVGDGTGSTDNFSKEDWGSGESLRVDKSKESMSTSSWGNVDKTSLRNKVLNARNYKSVVSDVYMLVEGGWEDSPSSHLKYPVMQISDGKLVYNRYGLASALQRAKGQGEDSVVSKINKIYNKLGIDSEQEQESFEAFAFDGENNETGETSQKNEKGYSDNVVEDNYLGLEEKKDMTKEILDKDKKEESFSEEDVKDENNTETLEMMQDGDSEEDQPEEDKKEEMAEEDAPEEGDDSPDEEPDGDEMSVYSFVEVKPVLDFLENETKMFADLDENAFKDVRGAINSCRDEIAKGKDANPELIFGSMLSYMKAISGNFYPSVSELSTLKKEVGELRTFKADVERDRKNFAVDKVLREASEAGMPKTEVEKCREDAANYSLQNISQYENMVKARAFKYFGKPANDDIGEVKIGMPFNMKKQTSPSVWD